MSYGVLQTSRIIHANPDDAQARVGRRACVRNAQTPPRGASPIAEVIPRSSSIVAAARFSRDFSSLFRVFSLLLFRETDVSIHQGIHCGEACEPCRGRAGCPKFARRCGARKPSDDFAQTVADGFWAKMAVRDLQQTVERRALLATRIARVVLT